MCPPQMLRPDRVGHRAGVGAKVRDRFELFASTQECELLDEFGAHAAEHVLMVARGGVGLPLQHPAHDRGGLDLEEDTQLFRAFLRRRGEKERLEQRLEPVWGLASTEPMVIGERSWRKSQVLGNGIPRAVPMTAWGRRGRLGAMYPPKLQNIIELFETLPEVERRETLVNYAESAPKQEPRPNEKFDLEDVRKDEECADKVGVYLQVDDRAARISG